MRNILLSSVAILAATSAFAADLPSRRQAPPPYIAPPPPIFTWTGVYVGGQIGYEFGHDYTHATGFAPGVASSPSGVVGGAHVGYNYQVAQFVFGLEGDVNGSSYSGSALNFAIPAAFSTKTPVDGSVRGRVGFAVNRVLVYATGGAAFASLTDTYAGPAGYSSLSHSRVGWTVGGGVEYAITNNWSVRGEYRYTDYGHYADFTGVTLPVSHHQTDNRVQIGFSYKFDTFAPPGAVLAKY